MTWGRRLRRWLLWAGVLGGLMLLLTAVSLLRVVLWTKHETGNLTTSLRPRAGATAR